MLISHLLHSHLNMPCLHFMSVSWSCDASATNIKKILLFWKSEAFFSSSPLLYQTTATYVKALNVGKEDWKPLCVTPWLKSLCIYLLYGRSICCAKKRELLESMAESSVSFRRGTAVSTASSTTCVTETTCHGSAPVAHPDCLGLHFPGGRKDKRCYRQQ